MTATERLRELLDERGVEWTSPSGLNSRFADSMTFIGNVAVVSEIEGSDLLRINFDGTPEQAIDATLGKEPDDVAILKLHDSMNTALLEYDRALGSEKTDYAITVPFVVEMHRLLEEAATLGAGTCKADETDTMECVCDGIGHYGEPLTVHVMECSACGGTYEHVNGGYEYCPRCGRRVVE